MTKRGTPMLNIQPQYLSLAKLLDGRLFRIPEYQRAYSWTSSQRGDLFGDLNKTFASGREQIHFMAAAVCLRRDRKLLATDEYQVLEIVDGQQRLTTLIVLLKIVAIRLGDATKIEKKLRDELNDLLVKPEGGDLLLLQTNHDSSHYFAKFLREGDAPDPSVAKTSADKEILQAIEDCDAFAVSWQTAGRSLLDLATLLKNRLYFLLHEIDQEKTVYTVFEVLNSRGLSVSWFDRLKSILMGMAFELPKTDTSAVIKDLHTTWRDIYGVIGLRQGFSTEALRFAATLRADAAPSRALSEEDAVSTLRAKGVGSAAKIRNVSTWLLDVTRACDAVVADSRLNAVTRISHARLLAACIELRRDIKKADQAKLLASWEKIVFRIYGMLDHDARTRVGDFVRLAWRVVNEKLSVAAIKNELAAIGKAFPVQLAVKNLREANCYESWENELRYLLFRYEEYLSKQQGMKFKNEQWAKIWAASASESIEHILPQSKASPAQKHRLGNLVLLPPRLNSQLQDKSPTEKIKRYRETGLLIANEVATMIEDEGWSVSSIEKREASILKWALTEWSD